MNVKASRPKAVVVVAIIGTAFIAVLAFWLSFTALTRLAMRADISENQAWAWPLIVDGVIVVATVAVVALRGRPGSKYAWALLVSGATVSVTANAIQAAWPTEKPIPAGMAAAICSVPPIVLLAITHLTVALGRHERAVAEPAPDPLAWAKHPATETGTVAAIDAGHLPSGDSTDTRPLPVAPPPWRDFAITERTVAERGGSGHRQTASSPDSASRVLEPVFAPTPIVAPDYEYAPEPVSNPIVAAPLLPAPEPVQELTQEPIPTAEPLVERVSVNEILADSENSFISGQSGVQEVSGSRQVPLATALVDSGDLAVNSNRELAALLRNQGMKVRDIADRIGVSESTARRWLRELREQENK